MRPIVEWEKIFCDLIVQSFLLCRWGHPSLEQVVNELAKEWTRKSQYPRNSSFEIGTSWSSKSLMLAGLILSHASRGFPGGSVVKDLPSVQEMQVRSLHWEDTLEKEMATHSSFLAWRIPGTGEPGGLPSLGLHRLRHDWSDSAAAAACLGCCEWCCYEHRGACIFLNSSFVPLYAQQWDCWFIW